MKCNVLFLGKSDPSRDAENDLDSLNGPLKKAYPAHNSDEISGIDSYITIYTSGILLQLVSGSNPPLFWFPIQNLYIAAANKCVNYIDPQTNQVRNSKFVELGTSEGSQSSHAPLFSFISRGSEDGVQQCYTFMTQNDEAAFSLVDNARHAYSNRSGHTSAMIPSEVKFCLQN